MNLAEHYHFYFWYSLGLLFRQIVRELCLILLEGMLLSIRPRHKLGCFSFALPSCLSRFLGTDTKGISAVAGASSESQTRRCHADTPRDPRAPAVRSFGHGKSVLARVPIKAPQAISLSDENCRCSMVFPPCPQWYGFLLRVLGQLVGQLHRSRSTTGRRQCVVSLGQLRLSERSTEGDHGLALVV